MTTNINADNGVVSGVAGLKTSADNSGVLALQTNGTTALTVNASQALGVGSTPSYGTSGQVLTSAGSGASPTWTTVGGGSSQWTTSGSDIYYSTGNVGINQSSPAYKLNVSGSGYIFGLNGGGTARVAQTFGNTGGNLDLGIESSTGNSLFTGSSAYAACIGSSNATNFQLGTNGNIRVTLNTTGAVALQGASTTANGIGITFPATQSASSDANTLDDYEEGTWTPTITPETGSFTTTSYTSANCTYVKIGKQVVCNIRWQIDSFGTGAGGCKISGLPFAIGSSQRGSSAGINGSNGWAFASLVYSDGNYVSFYKYDGTFTSADFQGKSLMATITYFV